MSMVAPKKQGKIQKVSDDMCSSSAGADASAGPLSSVPV